MKLVPIVVRTKEMDTPFPEAKVSVPETIQEAIDVYGAEAVFDVFHAGLMVKLQAQARNTWTSGTDEAPVTVQKVEEVLANYKPGEGIRRSAYAEVSDLMVLPEVAIALSQIDSEKRATIQALFRDRKYTELLPILKELKG